MLDGMVDQIACKAELRDLYAIGKHCVHISDSLEETRLTVTMFFNDHSLDQLRRAAIGTTQPNFRRLVDEFIARCGAARIDLGSVCLSGSAALAAYGIRDVRDLDFLHPDALDVSAISTEECSSHNEYVRSFGLDPEQIVFDARHHGFYRGLKVVALDRWTSLTRQRGEEKDHRDFAGLAGMGLLPP